MTPASSSPGAPSSACLGRFRRASAARQCPRRSGGLPLSQVALEILRDYRDTDEWNGDNWLKMAAITPANQRRDPEATQALGEAWQWLERRGLVARDPSRQDIPGARFATRLGHEALQEGGLARIQATERLGSDLHAAIADKIERQFHLGEFEFVVFAAMKTVEVRVREIAGLPESLLGTRLMQEAFKPDGGVLTDPAVDAGERVARMDLFKGAIGSFKNPSSHRDVDFDDPIEASEIVRLADLLHRILDRVEASATP